VELPGFDQKTFAKQLEDFAKLIPDEHPDVTGMKPATRKNLRARIGGVIAALTLL